MSFYQTPRRRHCSLFQRMENEIRKIKKRLSAAKDSYREAGINIKKSRFSRFSTLQDRNSLTTRKKQEERIQQSRQMKSHTINVMKDNNNNNWSSSKSALNIDKSLVNDKKFGIVDRIIIKLQDQNSKLCKRLGKMEALCEDQSYRFGYIRAELRETSRELARQKEKQMKETCYLTTLLEHYKSRAKKYKKLLKENSTISIDLGTEINV